MRTRTNRIVPALVSVAIIVVVGVFLTRSPDRAGFGTIVVATLYEDRSGFEDFMGEAGSRLLGASGNRDARRYLDLGGAPFEIGGASSNSAWLYLNHPKLNNQPQWEMALSSRSTLDDVVAGDLRCKFYRMNDRDGVADFGSDWKGHAVRVPERRVVFVRALTNQTVTYVIELLEVNRGRDVRPCVKVRHLSMAREGAANEARPIGSETNRASSVSATD